LHPNPSFENGGDPYMGWTASGPCTGGLSSFNLHGTYSLKVYNRMGTSVGAGPDVTGLIASGVRYGVTLYVYPTLFREDFRLTMRTESTGSGVQTVFTSWKELDKNSWGRLDAEFTPAWTGQLTRAFVYVESRYTTQSYYLDGNTLGFGAGSVFYEKPPDPAWAEDRVIRGKVLSPASNPFWPGVTNAEGIYVINLVSVRKPLSILRSRIRGTLVVLNAEARLHGAGRFEPAVANYPVILTNENLRLWCGGTGAARAVLDEGKCNVNFNPPGTPFEGAEDTDKADAYEALIRGIVYTTKEADIRYHPVLEGVLVANTYARSGLTTDPLSGTFRTYLDLTHLGLYTRNAPPGFRLPPVLKIAPGSMRQTVD
jgi:hypothetical protein